jgi:hypothetical protein
VVAASSIVESCAARPSDAMGHGSSSKRGMKSREVAKPCNERDGTGVYGSQSRSVTCDTGSSMM